MHFLPSILGYFVHCIFHEWVGHDSVGGKLYFFLFKNVQTNIDFKDVTIL